MTDNKWFKEELKKTGFSKDESAKQFDLYDLIDIAERYHQHKLKLLSISDVVGPKGTLSNLDKAIKKAKPNMDKIKDVDKHLDSIR